MCQLLGMNANTPTDVMFSFTGLATRADEHKDGFGVAILSSSGKGEALAAHISHRFAKTCTRTHLKSTVGQQLFQDTAPAGIIVHDQH